MATLLEYKAAVRSAVDVAVFGPLFLGFPQQVNQIARNVSDFGLERLQFRAQSGTGVDFQPTNGKLDFLYTMSPGSKIVQVQAWPTRLERDAGANSSNYLARTNILVHRALMGDWEANLYEDSEMLEDMTRLLDNLLYEDLDVVDGRLREVAEIASEPTRSGSVISYQVSFQAQVKAD